MVFINYKKHYYPFYTKDFNTYLFKCLQKKRPVIKKKAFMYVLKTIKNAKQNINHHIEITFLNFHTQTATSSVLTINNTYLKNSQINTFVPITYSLKKDLILTNIYRKRQFYFFFKEICCLCQKSTVYLICENFIKPKNATWYINNTLKTTLFYSKYLSNIFSSNHTPFEQVCEIPLALFIQNLYIKLFYPNLMALNVASPSNFSQTFIVYFGFYAHLSNGLWKQLPISNTLNITKTANLIKRLQASKAIFFGSSFFFSRCFKKLGWKFQNGVQNSNKFIWKSMNNNLSINKTRLTSVANKKFFIISQNHAQQINKKILIKKKRASFLNFSQAIYILLRFEEKIQLLAQKDPKTVFLKPIINLYNFLTNQITKKQRLNSANNLLLSNSTEIFQFKKTNWQKLLPMQFKTWLIDNKSHFESNKFFNFYLKIRTKLKTPIGATRVKTPLKTFLNVNIKKLRLKYMTNKNNVSFFNNLVAAKKSYLPKPNAAFLNKKLSYNANYLNYTNIKTFLKILTNKNIQIFYINALALTKYAFNYERVIEKKENRSPTLFLQNIDRDLINKYKYIGIYIKDLIRICFIGMFLKKPQFIAKFLAFQISKLPRNRKETSFIRFIIKVVKTFAAEREEILGLRIKFKGRVNRWRRTKSIIGSRGVLPLHTIDNFIECGSAQAINRKGALGIRIWIWYKPEFSVLLNNSIIKYFTYSKHLEKKKQLINSITFTKKIK